MFTAGFKPNLENVTALSSKGVHMIRDIGVHWDKLGTQFLEDPNGSRVEAIGQRCLGDCDKINRAILMEWLRGGEKGRPVTWAVLCEALRNAGLVTLADEIVRALLS